jgi:8-oxo-dGTP diphosphatase
MGVSKKRIHVAVGVVQNHNNEVLIAKRAADSHQGGLWEFPGGKVEAGELQEELGISAVQLLPLIKVHHDYPDKSVLLDVWRVVAFTGEPRGLQQQPLRWVPHRQLYDYDFPAANQPIITALRVPTEMMITGDWENTGEFRQRLVAAFHKGVRLVQLRAHACAPVEYVQLFRQAKSLCDDHGVLLMANTSLDLFQQLSADGLHLTSRRLLELVRRPVDKRILLSASCHNQEQIRQAERVGVDYLVTGPVYPTATHPQAVPLGLEAFSKLVDSTSLPVFALGGIQSSNKEMLRQAGAYGIAGIRFWW